MSEQEPPRPRSQRAIRRRMRLLRVREENERIAHLQTPLTTQPFGGGTPEPGLNAG